MSNPELTRNQLPEDGHKKYRIRIMALIHAQRFLRAKGNHAMFRLDDWGIAEKCSTADEAHVQLLINIGFVAEDTRSVTRYLDAKKEQPIRLNPLFLGHNGREYLATHYTSSL